MFKKISSAVSSITGSPAPKLPPTHHDIARVKEYSHLAKSLDSLGVPVSLADCRACDEPCADDTQPAGIVAEMYLPNEEKYAQAIEETYGDLGDLPKGFDTDWESDLAGSGNGGKGRIVVVSTGKSDWERNHTDEKALFSHQLHKHIETLSIPEARATESFLPSYIAPSPLPPPSTLPPANQQLPPPSIYSSSLISQSDDPEDQSVLIFPDWKVVHEVENSLEGAEGLWDNVLEGRVPRAGKGGAEEVGVGRKRSWVLPYRAVVLLCSHKRRDKRCHIAAPLLRSALHTTLSKYDITIDETGSSLTHLTGPPLESLEGTAEEKEKEVGKRIGEIESVSGGEGGEVGIFDINHLGGHRYAGVMIILFPSGAYLSYGRVTPQEIPRIVEDTILRGQIVPGLLRNAVGVVREKGMTGPCVKEGQGFLGW